MKSDNKNVLFLFYKMDCHDGIASYCDALVGGLSKFNVAVYIVSGSINFDESTKGRRDAIEAKAIELQTYPKLRLIPRIADVLALARVMRERDIKIIHIHALTMLPWGRTLALVTGARLVATYHPSMGGSLQTVRAKAAEKISFARRLALNLFFPDRLIVLSEESKALVGHYAPGFKGRIVKIPGAVNPVFRPPQPFERVQARAEFGYDSKDFVCLLLGRLSWNKGHDILIKATRIANRECPSLNIKCLFVGKGTQEQEIKDFISPEEFECRMFKFLGYINSVERSMWAADLFVLPSRVEGFALVIAEAMATGLVPIRTPSGGAMDQVVEGETGLLVPFEDPNALASAIVSMHDAKRRSQMSKNCIARAARLFSVDASCESTRAIYAELAR